MSKNRLSNPAYVLDTDIVGLFFHHRAQQPGLERRILESPRDSLWVSVITVEEVVQGAISLIRRNEQMGKHLSGYALLAKVVPDLAAFQILPYDGDADRIYRAMSPATRRVGRNDCRIAASAIACGYTVVTRNGRDFAQIPDVRWEDWTH